MHTHPKDKFYSYTASTMHSKKHSLGTTWSLVWRLLELSPQCCYVCVKQTLFLGKQASYFTCSSILSCSSGELIIFMSQNLKCFFPWSFKQYLPHANVGVDANFFQHFAMHMMCLWNIINNISTLKNKNKNCSTLLEG